MAIDGEGNFFVDPLVVHGAFSGLTEDTPVFPKDLLDLRIIDKQADALWVFGDGVAFGSVEFSRSSLGMMMPSEFPIAVIFSFFMATL